MTHGADSGFDEWFARLRRLAAERDLVWLVSTQTELHREAYAQGRAPEDELNALADMAQWRGCGCGGG